LSDISDSNTKGVYAFMTAGYGEIWQKIAILNAYDAGIITLIQRKKLEGLVVNVEHYLKGEESQFLHRANQIANILKYER
jgi:hypothetical protein